MSSKKQNYWGGEMKFFVRIQKQKVYLHVLHQELSNQNIMSKKETLTGTWAEGVNKIYCKIPLIIFQEDNTTIVYCPALDLSGYGDTEEEARNSFQIVLSEYFRYTEHKKTLAADLKEHGWILKKNLSKGATPPTMGQLLESNEDFNRIFNTHEFKKTDTTIEIPCLA